MDILTILAIAIPSTLSVINSIIHTYISLKKAKEPPKDEIWETTTKLICSGVIPVVGADEFADVYEQLKLFKDNGCSMKDITTLSHAVMTKHKSE